MDEAIDRIKRDGITDPAEIDAILDRALENGYDEKPVKQAIDKDALNKAINDAVSDVVKEAMRRSPPKKQLVEPVEPVQAPPHFLTQPLAANGYAFDFLCTISYEEDWLPHECGVLHYASNGLITYRDEILFHGSIQQIRYLAETMKYGPERSVLILKQKMVTCKILLPEENSRPKGFFGWDLEVVRPRQKFEGEMVVAL